MATTYQEALRAHLREFNKTLPESMPEEERRAALLAEIDRFTEADALKVLDETNEVLNSGYDHVVALKAQGDVQAEQDQLAEVRQSL
ncbi:MAG: hypothetical protein WCO52_00290 [bacterium]